MLELRLKRQCEEADRRSPVRTAAELRILLAVVSEVIGGLLGSGEHNTEVIRNG